MSERNIIENTKKPNTFNSLVEDFQGLGIKPKMNLIVHSSLSSLGWTVGGGVTVIKALQEIITPSGTIVMPSHTTNNTDPTTWRNPSIPKDWVSDVKKSMIGFEKDITPPYFMGEVVNLFKSFPDVQRSNHPLYSFLSWGKNTNFILSDHSLDNGLGLDSPLGKLYTINSHILLLGTGYKRNTSMHLAEHLVEQKKNSEIKTLVLKNEKSVWITTKDIEYHEELFEEIGDKFESSNKISKRKIGNANVRLINLKSIVNFTTEYLNNLKKSQF